MKLKKLFLTINEKIHYCLRTKDLKLRMKFNQAMVDGFIEGFNNPTQDTDTDRDLKELVRKINKLEEE